MDICSPELWESFYDPLVGTPEARQAVRHNLSDRVGVALAIGDDPYEVLRAAFQREVDISADRCSPYFSGEISSNAEVGRNLVIAGLKTVGQIYTAQARQPQRIDNVRGSVHRLTNNMYSLATGDGWSVIKTFNALSKGRNAHSRWTEMCRQLRPRVMFSDIQTTIDPKSFDVTKSCDQVSVSLRYKRLVNPEAEDSCPAAHARIEVDGRNRPALQELLRTIGDVAVDRIYPRLFPITTE